MTSKKSKGTTHRVGASKSSKKKKSSTQTVKKRDQTYQRLKYLFNLASESGLACDWQEYFRVHRELHGKTTDEEKIDIYKKAQMKKIKPFMDYMEQRWFLAGKFKIVDYENYSYITLKPAISPYNVSDMKEYIEDALMMHGITDFTIVPWMNEIHIY